MKILNVWNMFCSLKLAIVLTSVTTLIVIGGSLVMPFNPRIFSSMDSITLGMWLNKFAGQAPALTWWVVAAGILILLLGFNTLCCFIDWLIHIRTGWRKCGEYFIHLGFVLLVVAYMWGSQAGFRSANNPLFVGRIVPLQLPGMYLKLERFEPIFNDSGRPIDMINTLILYDGDREVKRIRAHINYPLTWNGLVVLPTSYGRNLVRSRSGMSNQYRMYTFLTINYDPGANLALVGGGIMGCGILLALVSFYSKRFLR